MPKLSARAIGGVLPNRTKRNKHPSMGCRMFDQLTEKQREVLALVADNRTSKEMARVLGISESAVNQRIEAIRRLADGAPRAELARLWREHGAGALDPTCKPLTGQSSCMADSGAFGEEDGAGRKPDGTATTSVPAPGSHQLAIDRSSIVPAALDGPQGTFHRLVLVVVMAAGLLTMGLAGLSIVENLAALAGRRSAMQQTPGAGQTATLPR